MNVARPPDPSAPAVDLYSRAAARACVFELKSRLFADVVPALRCFSRGNFSQLVTAIAAWMEAKSRGTPEERQHLRTCVTLRNKLLHADLSRAAVHAKALGATLSEGSLKQVTVPGKFTAESFLAAVADTASHVEVASTKSEHAPIFGWLMESWGSGVFVEAERLFDQAIGVLEREAWALTDEDTSAST